jgi:hypothetical protein
MNITPCSLLKVSRRFGATCRLHFHGRRISQSRHRSRYQALLAACFMLASCLAYPPTMKMEAT